MGFTPSQVGGDFTSTQKLLDKFTFKVYNFTDINLPTIRAEKTVRLKFCAFSLLIISLVILSCSTSRYLTPLNTIATDSLRKITDEDIKKAFEAQPQLKAPLNIAVFNAGFEYPAFVDSLRKRTNVNDVYIVSPVLIEGDLYYQKKKSRWYSYYRTPTPINIEQLRLFAAQAKADLLLFYGISMSEEIVLNSVAWTYFLVIPAFFAHGNTALVKAQVDLYYIDVRNGFLYKYVSLEDKFQKKVSFPTTTDENSLDKVRLQTVNLLLSKMIQETEEVLTNPQFFVKE